MSTLKPVFTGAIFRLCVGLVVWMTTTAGGAAELTKAGTVRPSIGSPLNPFERCESCNGCHANIYREHVGSMHSQSFANPVFLAQYTQQVLPLAQSSLDAFKDARSCTACHAPVAHQLSRARLVLPDPSTAEAASVTCDFCHTIKDYKGQEPKNANYIVEPGPSKFGPFQTRTDWHHRYSELQTKSEFCAICHCVQNRFGLTVKSTYTEWKASRHAREGIQCQDCHMSVNGFLTEGRPVHASGQAARMDLGFVPVRSQLYTHRFQGARSHSQIEGAISLAFQAQEGRAARPGETLKVSLHVDNSRTGHKMPSGSVELRFLWLDVSVEVGEASISLAPTKDPEGFNVTGGRSEIDREILGSSLASGRRIYRTLLADGRGKITLTSHLAQSIVYDNRLNASEVRAESYEVQLPPTTASKATLRAVMYYVAYPDSFADQFGLAHADPVQIAATSAEIALAQPAVQAGD